MAIPKKEALCPTTLKNAKPVGSDFLTSILVASISVRTVRKNRTTKCLPSCMRQRMRKKMNEPSPCKMFFLKHGRVYVAEYKVPYKWHISQLGCSIERHPAIGKAKPARRADMRERFASGKPSIHSL